MLSATVVGSLKCTGVAGMIGNAEGIHVGDIADARAVGHDELRFTRKGIELSIGVTAK